MVNKIKTKHKPPLKIRPSSSSSLTLSYFSRRKDSTTNSITPKITSPTKHRGSLTHPLLSVRLFNKLTLFWGSYKQKGKVGKKYLLTSVKHYLHGFSFVVTKTFLSHSQWCNASGKGAEIQKKKIELLVREEKPFIPLTNHTPPELHGSFCETLILCNRVGITLSFVLIQCPSWGHFYLMHGTVGTFFPSRFFPY